MRPTPDFDNVFAGFLIRTLPAQTARVACAKGLVGVLSVLAFGHFFRSVPERHRAFFYGPVQMGNAVERVFADRPCFASVDF